MSEQISHICTEAIEQSGKVFGLEWAQDWSSKGFQNQAVQMGS